MDDMGAVIGSWALILVILAVLAGAGQIISEATKMAPWVGRLQAMEPGSSFVRGVPRYYRSILVVVGVGNHASSRICGGARRRRLDRPTGKHRVSWLSGGNWHGPHGGFAEPGRLVQIVANKAYRALGAGVSEGAKRALADAESTRTAQHHHRVEQAARTEAAERAAKDRIHRRF